jgi:hypothetical protein
VSPFVVSAVSALVNLLIASETVIVCMRLLTWFLLPSAVSLQLIVPMV